jgi:ABC-type protease/lipase transport system fused ATPase/permease subunit
MWKRVAVAGVGCVLVTVLAFLIDPILGSFVGIFGVIAVVVLAVASDWDSHPDFEQRELARARRRAARKEANWEKNSAARERDRARYAARQAKLAAKRAGDQRRAS